MKSLRNAFLAATAIAFTAGVCSAETLSFQSLEKSRDMKPTMTVGGAPGSLSIAARDLDARASQIEKLDLSKIDQTPIPEPPVYMLLGLGLLLCAQRIRRRMATTK